MRRREGGREGGREGEVDLISKLKRSVVAKKHAALIEPLYK